MREEKRVICVDDFQHNLLINGMNEFRNELLLMIIDAPTKKELKRASREAR